MVKKVEEEHVPEAANEQEETNAQVKAAFDAAMSVNNNPDSVKLAMIQAGATFKNVARLYNQFMVESGLMLSKEDKGKIQAEVLDSGRFNITEQEGFEAAAAELMAKSTELTDRQAAAMIRSWAKKNSIDAWKRPAGTGDGAPRGFRSAFLEALEANPRMTEAEVTNLLKTHPLATDAARSVEGRWQRFRLMANRIAGVA